MTWQRIDRARIKYPGVVSWLKANPAISFSILLMAVVLVFTFFLKIRFISGNMPYPSHPDERYIAEPALNMLKTGDFNPHSFRYPSFPIYLTAISFTIGYLNSAANLELKNTEDLEPNVYPYFKHPRIIWYAKVVFVLLSTIAMIFMALIAYRLYKNPFVLFGVPLIVSLSYQYFLSSAKYINVDIVAAFFIFLVYWHHSITMNTDSILQKVAIPGILSGLVIACKYNLVWIIVPSMLVIFFHVKRRRVSKIGLLFLIMLLTFILVVPFSILDFNTFLDWLAYDIVVYKKGDALHSTTPGLTQLIHYLSYFYYDFKLALCVLAFFGIIAVFLRDWKIGIILLSFPVLTLLQMSSYAIHYARNVLSLFGIFAIFAAIGTVWLYELLCRFLFKLSRPRLPKGIKQTAVFLLLSIILFFPVQERLTRQLELKPDTRNQALTWITQNVEKKRDIIVSRELAMNVNPLKEDYNIVFWDFDKANGEALYTQVAALKKPIVVMPVFCPHYKRQEFAVKWADELNTIGNSLNILVTFNGSEAIINAPVHITGKSPKILIGTFR